MFTNRWQIKSTCSSITATSFMLCLLLVMLLQLMQKVIHILQLEYLPEELSLEEP